MPKSLKHTILAITISIAALTAPVSATGARKGWEPIKTERSDTRPVAKDTDVEIKSASGVIEVRTSKPLQIKIFTILGRLVSSDTLQPGSAQFLLPAHGVYVVQAGEITCKIAV